MTVDTCPTCGGSLAQIADEFRQTCTARSPAEAKGLARFAIAPNSASPAAAAAAAGGSNLSALAAFLRRMDRDVVAALLGG